MKQTTALFVAMVMGLMVQACRAERNMEAAGTADGLVSVYDHRNFTQVEVSGQVEAHIAQGADYGVEVAESSNPNMQTVVELRGETLHIYTRQLKKNVSLRDGQAPVVRITMPSLGGLRASGATSVEVGNFSTTGRFAVNLSGASRIRLGRVSCASAKLTCSGASAMQADIQARGDIETGISGAGKLTLTLAGSRLRMVNSGASASRVSFSGDSVEVRNSGAGKTDLTVDCRVLKVQNSGASKFTISGTADQTDIDASGASKIDTENLNKF